MLYASLHIGLPSAGWGAPQSYWESVIRLQDRNRNVGGVGDGLLQGTEALARGFGYGITGVVTKPITNARQHGFVGFFQGLGKAALGFVMLPVSGVLDFVSLTVNGVGVSCTSCFELFEHEPVLTRKRLPRSIRGSSIIFPYNPHDAQGQVLVCLPNSSLWTTQPLYFTHYGCVVYRSHFGSLEVWELGLIWILFIFFSFYFSRFYWKWSFFSWMLSRLCSR